MFEDLIPTKSTPQFPHHTQREDSKTEMEMKTSSIIAIFIVSIFGWSAHLVNSQTDSCNSNLNLNGLPFDTTSLHCVSAWSSQDYILRYEQSSENLWNFVLSTPSENSFVAIGFSSDGNMVGSSAIVGWSPSSGALAMIKQYHLTGQTPQQVIPDEGNLNITTSTIISQSSRLFLAFQLATEMPLRPIYSLGPDGFIPSAPSYQLKEHKAYISTTLNYLTGQTSQTTKNNTGLRRGHGVLVIVGWGILMAIGAICARYLKEWDPAWFYAHVGVQSLGFVLGIIGVIAGFVLEDRVTRNVSTHKALGIFVLVLGCLQVMAFLARPDKTSKVRKYWNWYHYGVGRSLMVLAMANVFYGIHIAKEHNSWNVGYGIILGILFLIAVILEIRMWTRK